MSESERKRFLGRLCQKVSLFYLFVSFSPLNRFFPFQTEGCDGVLGSGAVIDKCGVCGGRESSCRKVAGSFQNVTVPHGYHKILDIPSGATFINITERRASPNYLGETCCSWPAPKAVTLLPEANATLFLCCFHLRRKYFLSLFMWMKVF